MSGTTILLVEDSPEDAEAAIRGLRKFRMGNPLRHCPTGDDALDYLYGRGSYSASTAPRPGIILLDLNLPGTDGREVLAELKSHPDLKRIPVIVMTTSSDPRDIQACYDAGANSYVVKPVSLEGLMKAIQQLTDYWFQIVVLPNGAD